MIVIPSESIFDVLVGANVHFSDNIEVKFSIMSLVGRFAGVFLAITAVGTAAGVYYVHVDAQNQQQVRLFVFCMHYLILKQWFPVAPFVIFPQMRFGRRKVRLTLPKLRSRFGPSLSFRTRKIPPMLWNEN
jgi:hypothetical protein